MNYPTPFVSAVVRNRDEIFLLGGEGEWDLPGWPLEGGLAWLGTLARGLESALGLRFEEAHLISVFSDPEVYVAKERHLVGGLFLITKFEGEPRGGRWFPLNQLPQGLSTRVVAEIRDAIAFRGDVTVR